MTPQSTLTAPTWNGRRSGTGLRSGTRAVRRRAIVAALGLAVLAAVVPVTAAHAAPQSPGVDTHFTNPGGNPQPPTPPEPPQPPDLPDFPGDLANPTDNPEPPLPPEPPDVPDWGPDDLANPTENPEPPLPPEPPDNGPGDLVNPTENPEPPTPPVDPDPSATRSRPHSASTPGSGGPPTGPTRPPAWP
jgi:hypothetical protein